LMSARPGKIKEIINIDLPRPRDRTSLEANVLRDRILKSLLEEQKK
jgi:NitT/TauT family transport system ATP-binding protein